MPFELKLSIDPDKLAVLRTHPLLRQYAIGSPRTQRQTVVYFDTPDADFTRNGLAVCTHWVNHRRVQTLEIATPVIAGLHQRQTWALPIGAGQPDIAALIAQAEADKAWPKPLSHIVPKARLVAACTVFSRRTVWLLRTAQGEVELALSRGEARCDAAQADFFELALTLRAGEPAALFALALALLPVLPMRILHAASAQRAFLLFSSTPMAPVRAQSVLLAVNKTMAQGLQAIIGNCLAQVQANESGVVMGYDPEWIHQMRVGLRRLNSALGLFRERAPCPPDLLADLAWIRRTLGVARDWEVLAGETLDKVPATAQAGLTPLRREVEKIARSSRRKAVKAILLPRYTQCLLALGNWAISLETNGSSALTVPLPGVAREVLAQRHERLQKRCRKLPDATVEKRHRARIAAKKMRYACEFFQSLYPGTKMRPYVQALAALQETLGWLNDVIVADDLLRQLVLRRPELAQGASFVQGYLAARSRPKMQQLGRLWKQFRLVRPPN